MTDVHATVVLIADKDNPDSKLVTNHLNQHFPSIRLVCVTDEEARRLDEGGSVCLFITIVDSNDAKWSNPLTADKSPLVSAIAYSSLELDPVAMMKQGFTDVVSDGNVDHLVLILEYKIQALTHIRGLTGNVGLTNSDFTGVHSRLEFLESVSILSESDLPPFSAILYLQLDNFTWINENLGMTAGDRYLKDVGAALNSIMKSGDFAARFQGGNFILFVTADDQQLLSSKADMVRETVHELTTEHDDNILSSTASIGARMFAADLAVQDLIANAYDASDVAKANGGDTVHYYRQESDDSPEMQSKRAWNDRIKKAFDKDLFVLYYQPIVSLMSDSTPRYEVLLRMQDDEQAIISPGTFLPYAERAGLMSDIDRKVISQSVKNAIAHRASAGDEPELFIKLSGMSVDDTSMASWISNTLKELDYPPSKIVFEITESIALHHMVQTRMLCQKLRELGARLALDHFGTRFRSFKLLETLNLDYVKIDGSIVQHLANNKGHQAIIKRIIKAANKQDIQLVAESVQEASSLPIIWQNDIPLVQGFFLGVPTSKMEYDFRNMLI